MKVVESLFQQTKTEYNSSDKENKTAKAIRVKEFGDQEGASEMKLRREMIYLWCLRNCTLVNTWDKQQIVSNAVQDLSPFEKGEVLGSG